MLPLSLLDLTEAVGGAKIGSVRQPLYASGASSKLDNSAPIAFTRSTLGLRRVLVHRFSLLCKLDASLLAGVGFPIESLGYRRWPSNVAQFQDLYFKFPAFIANVKPIAQPHFTGWLGLHSI
jgi:hypothetical protein